jgi:hypothetical protein
MMTQKIRTDGGRLLLVLADAYLARHGSPFAAYMALQCALLERFVARGGSPDEWCNRLAPVFRRRYAPVFAQHLLN